MNIFFPPHQEIIFLLMSLCGIFLSAIYDIFKVKRKMFGSCTLILFIDDFIFSFVSAVTFVFFIFILNNGILRWYELFFCIIGFIVYRCTISKLVMPLFEFIIVLIKKLIIFIFTPLYFVFNKISMRFLLFFYKKKLYNKICLDISKIR